jgi:hypothetical protein
MEEVHQIRALEPATAWECDEDFERYGKHYLPHHWSRIKPIMRQEHILAITTVRKMLESDLERAVSAHPIGYRPYVRKFFSGTTHTQTHTYADTQDNM